MNTTPRIVVVTLCLLAGWAYLGRTSRAETLPPREKLSALPMQMDGWSGRNEAALDKDVLEVLGVDDYIVRTYFKPQGPAVGLYIGFYETQRQGDTVHSPLNCLPGAGWIPLEQSHAVLQVRQSAQSPATMPIEINRVVIGKGLDRNFVYYWYQSRDRIVASEYWGKIYTVLDSVRYNRSDAALVRVIVPMPANDAAAAETRATGFVETLFPQLSRFIPI